MTSIEYHLFETPVGWVALLGSSKGLQRLNLKPSPQEALEDFGEVPQAGASDSGWFVSIQSCVERYLAGEMDALNEIDLDLEEVPPFFRAAWEACRSIPFGETRTYGWLAAQAGNPLAVRAAGQAMAKNRWPLIIPCHRVIGSDGGLHGYGAGGLEVKARLLEMERDAALQLQDS